MASKAQREVAAESVRRASDDVPGVSAIGIDIAKRVVEPIRVAVPALRIEERRSGVRVRIDGGEPSDLGSVVPRPEVIEPRLAVAFLARELTWLAGGEAGVRGAGAGGALLAEGEVVVALDDLACLDRDLSDVAGGVEVVVLHDLGLPSRQAWDDRQEQCAQKAGSAAVPTLGSAVGSDHCAHLVSSAPKECCATPLEP